MSDCHGSNASGTGSSSGAGARNPSSEALSLREFLRVNALPALVRIEDADRSPELRHTVDLTRPVLLYKEYQSVKLHSRSLNKNEAGELEEVGPTIVIPEGYRGWFSVVTEDGKTAPYYSSVEEVAAARLAVFLTRHDLPGYVMSNGDHGGTMYQKVVVGAGNVLRLMGVFRDLSTTSAISSPSRNANYAQCVNYKNEALFLPFSAEGRFYAAATQLRDSRDHVFLMSQLLRQQKPPMTVKLVCGFMPRMPCNFTGLLRLEEIRPERLVLGCTTDVDSSGTLFELSSDSSLRLLRVDLLDRQLSPAFTKALIMCEQNGESWRNQMKVSHDVFDQLPTPSPSDTSPISSLPVSRQVAGVAPAKPAAKQASDRPSNVEPSPKKPLTKTTNAEGERKPVKSLRQTVSKFFLNRSRGNRDVPTSFVFSRPPEMPYGRVRDDISPMSGATTGGENVYAEICDKRSASAGRVAALRSAGDYTLRLGSDGQSSAPSSPGDTMEYPVS